MPDNNYPKIKQSFIAWVAFQRRSLSMKEYFNYELKFITFAFKNRILRPLEYLYKTFITFSSFIKERPNVIWIQLPPNILLHLAYIYKILFDRQLLIIADCHNATFRKPWIKIPGTVFLLNKCDLVLIHNDSVKQQALDSQIDADKIYVLEDPPASLKSNIEEPNELHSTPQIVCPCSFNRDEPIAEILDAARLMPEITVIITGNYNRAKGIHDLSDVPDNVKLTGFISTEEFDLQINRANAILGLTKLDGIQLSVANEALGASKPMILAHTETLKKLFYRGAVYVNPLQADSIARGCQEAIAMKEQLREEVIKLRREKESSWLKQADIIKDKLLSSE